MRENVSEKNPFGHLSCAVLSDVGRKRKNNEDAAASFPGNGVWCVADGMGGGDDGEVASGAVIRAVDACLSSMPTPSRGRWYSAASVVRSISAAIGDASAWIHDRAARMNLSGCGSTVVGVAFDATCPGTAVAFHVGDSRLYRLHGREIRQITKDHSVEELMGAKDEAAINPMFRGMILRAVGVEKSVDIDVSSFPVHEGDVVLLCSDGLSRMVDDAKMLEIVREADGDMQSASARLVEAANNAGGVDNITVALIGVGAIPPPLAAVQIPEDEGSDETGTTGGRALSLEDAMLGFVSAHWRGLAMCIASVTVALAVAIMLFAGKPSGNGESAMPASPARRAAETPGPAPENAPVRVAPADRASHPDVAAKAAGIHEPSGMETVLEDHGKGSGCVSGSAGQGSTPSAAAETREERELREELEKLAAMRDRRRHAAEAAEADDRKRLEAAKGIAAVCRSEGFRRFAAAAERAVGEGSTAKLQSLGKELHRCGNNDDIRVLAADFVDEIRRVAKRVSESSGKGVDRRLEAACRELAESPRDAMAAMRTLDGALKRFSAAEREGHGRDR